MLEFPAIVERLAGATESAAAPSSRASSCPRPTRDEVAARQALTAEGIALLETRRRRRSPGSPTSARRPRGRRATASLGPRDLRAVADRSPSRSRRGGALAEAPRPRRSSRDLLDAGRPVARGARRRRSTAASRTTAPICATPPRPRCAACANELRQRQAARDRGARRASRARASSPSSCRRRFVTERGGRPVLAVKTSARGEGAAASSTTRRARARRCSSSRSRSSS